MEVVCAWEGVFGGDLSIHLFEYKVIIMIDIIVVCCVGAYVFIISLELMKKPSVILMPSCVPLH